MKNPRTTPTLLLALILGGLVADGCNSPQITTGSKPEERLNPALSTHQKQVQIARAKRDAQ